MALPASWDTFGNGILIMQKGSNEYKLLKNLTVLYYPDTGRFEEIVDEASPPASGVSDDSRSETEGEYAAPCHYHPPPSGGGGGGSMTRAASGHRQCVSRGRCASRLSGSYEPNVPLHSTARRPSGRCQRSTLRRQRWVCSFRSLRKRARVLIGAIGSRTSWMSGP